MPRTVGVVFGLSISFTMITTLTCSPTLVSKSSKFQSMQSFKACWDCCAVLGNNDLREALAELTRTELPQRLLPGGL